MGENTISLLLSHKYHEVQMYTHRMRVIQSFKSQCSRSVLPYTSQSVSFFRHSGNQRVAPNPRPHMAQSLFIHPFTHRSSQCSFHSARLAREQYSETKSSVQQTECRTYLHIARVRAGMKHVAWHAECHHLLFVKD